MDQKEGIYESMAALRDLGNTVIVVEHDKNTIKRADHVIDIGPKAGESGGELVYQGDYDGLLTCPNSITGRYLAANCMPVRKPRHTDVTDQPQLIISDAQTNNLKNLTVAIPLNALVGVAGLSGSGKSSLISDTLIPLLKAAFSERSGGVALAPEEDPSDDREEIEIVQTIAKKLDGSEAISGYAEISQAPIGRNMNSNPATYIGIWDKIRKLYAQQPLAVKRNFKPGHFSL
jgi:excinuclease UvrABC ATPase subunit